MTLETPENSIYGPGDYLTEYGRKVMKEDLLAGIAEGDLGFSNQGLAHLDEFNDDREVILGLVKLDGSYLSIASDRLKADREVVLETFNHDSRGVITGETIDSVLKNFINDREVLTVLLGFSGSLLREIPEYKDDEELVRVAVGSNPRVITMASPRLQKILAAENKDLEEYLKPTK